MYQLLSASFGIIARKFPTRAFLQATSLNAAIGVFTITAIASALEMLASGETFSSTLLIAIVVSVAISLGALLVILLIGRWVINRYVNVPFSYTEMFALEMLLTGATQVIISVAMIVALFLGAGAVTAIGVVSLIFGVYMLLTFQKAVSSIALITKSQAANVIIAPILVILVVWFGFGVTIFGGLAATQ